MTEPTNGIAIGRRFLTPERRFLDENEKSKSIEVNLEKGHGTADSEETRDVTNPEQMRGYSATGWNNGDDEDKETEATRELAGNWPGIGEAIRKKHIIQRAAQPRLLVVTATVEDTRAHFVAAGEYVQLTHVAQGTDEAALEAFYERCEAMHYEVLEEPTVEQISLEELLVYVNDPEINLGAGVVPDELSI